MKLAYYLDRITQLADWFIPADMAANREQREKARIFLYSHLLGPFIGNTVTVSFCLFDKAIDYRVIVIGASITGFWIFPPLLRAFGHYYLLSVLSVQNLIFVILWGCYCYGGLSSPTLTWIAIIPLLAFMYVGHSVPMRIVLIAQFIAQHDRLLGYLRELRAAGGHLGAVGLAGPRPGFDRRGFALRDDDGPILRQCARLAGRTADRGGAASRHRRRPPGGHRRGAAIGHRQKRFHRPDEPRAARSAQRHHRIQRNAARGRGRRR